LTQQLTLSIVGSGGDGAVVAGDIIANACAHEGLNVIKTEAYGPQIRGGESSCTVRISATRIYTQADSIDAMVVFAWSDFARFRSELVLAENAIVFHDEADPPPNEVTNVATRRFFAVPFAAARTGKNIFALGLLGAAFGLPQPKLRAAVEKRFRKKKAEVQEANLKAFDACAAFFAEGDVKVNKLTYVPGPSKFLISGNEASAVGAVEAGCRFFAGYPITPSSEILHFLAEWLPKIGGNAVQTEDELSAIGAVIGASFAGTKAMTATSGPGLALMAELLGLASMAEIPAVVVDVQRGGPSTGLPTKSEQSDLSHAVYASHGDSPRVVLACTDAEDAFHQTVEAFNLAEEFQVPVILLSDQLIGQRRETVAREDLIHDVRERRIATPDDLEDYRRYLDTKDGVSPMSIPGTPGGMYQTNGLEHDERGRPSSMYLVHQQMNEKRYRKLDAIAKKYRLFRRFGPANPELGIICWGSSAGTVREAITQLEAEGHRVAAFVPQIITPLPAADLQSFIDECGKVLVIELSFAKQFYQYLRTQVDLPKSRTEVYARSGGKSLSVSEVASEVRRLLTVGKVEEVLA